MALQHSYFTSQDDFTREARILVYTYEKYLSREKRLEDRDRYPSVYKLFNNRPSFGDASAGAQMSRTPVASREIIHPKAHPDDTGRSSPGPLDMGKLIGNKSQAPVPSQHYVVTQPKGSSQTVEFVKYGDTCRGSQSPRSPQPHVGIQMGDSRERERVVGCEKEISHGDKKHEGDLGDEQCVDTAAAGFIEWKLRTLKLGMA